ncbi:zinc-dependent alcohol dehydrogenase family protein [Microcella alkaliphila]|uniref:Alcohol dehydrogenase GroES domain-containing pr otein n=1 Tax=Microcella alkaliphila TaxID=279828 RepID=A0A0U5BCD4_9MICO|nr:zinc-dependent alcohol dehydrogenase family protein [Microcella alkaliphila]BAU33396.1 alcohol dehydrogenase GroES domain-containing pr otein [Microcella alkaliphila]
MTLTMKAVRLHGPGDLRLDDVPVPFPGHGEVRIAVWRSGICGTDLHIAKGTFPAPNLPLTLGHEFSGVVDAVGPGVDGIHEGAQVVADINVSCGHCYYCTRGQKLFCPAVAQLGVHRAGGLAEYVLAPATNIHVLPNGIDLDAAAYVEPLACAIHGQDRIGINVGETVLVIGGGPMGLAHIVLARLNGASRVIVSEPDATRRALAADLGADDVINPLASDIELSLPELTSGVGPDVVIEAVGSVRTYETAVALVRRGGRILAYGAAPQDASMTLRPFDIYSKELTIVGSYAGTYDTWPRAIALIAQGRFAPAKIVDSIRPLSEAVDAIKALEHDRSTIKVHISIADR